MVAAELVLGGIGCLICSIFCCLATQMQSRNRVDGLPGAPCCAGGPPKQYERNGMLQQNSEMEGIAIEQADRANRLEAYIQRQRTAAAENILNRQRPAAAEAQPHPAPAPPAAAAPTLPWANRIPAGRPVMLQPGNSQAMFRPMPPMMAPYQMNQSPYAGTPILFFP